MQLNSEAAKHQKSGDHIQSLAIYSALFDRATRRNITHPEMYICYSNAAAASLSIHHYDQALSHAETCRQLAESALKKNTKAFPTYIKSFIRKGQALQGLSRHREAVNVFNQALKLDPFNLDLKLGLETANQAVLEDLVHGKNTEKRAITYPDKSSQRIAYHPHSAPLHRIRNDDMLPLRLLTPFQAENDHNIKDTYNYLTIQTDIRMPRRQIEVVKDDVWQSAWATAIYNAVMEIRKGGKKGREEEEEDDDDDEIDCRVLDLGAGAGLHSAIALQSGAHHVTAVERWLYLALTAQETLSTLGKDDSDNHNSTHKQQKTGDDDTPPPSSSSSSSQQYKVIYKRPTDLVVKEDIPVCCNLVIADMFDQGLLMSGIIPSLSHCLGSGTMVTEDAIILPGSATVYVQAIELRTTEVAGFDMSAANLYRFQPAYTAGLKTGDSSSNNNIVALSEPVEVWYFDMKVPPEKSDTKSVDLTFIKDGRFNAVRFWFTLHLHGNVYVSTFDMSSSDSSSTGTTKGWLQPAVQYLAGEMTVRQGSVLPLLASHNTVRMRFDIEEADYVHLYKCDASFPQRHFSMLADHSRAEAYQRAIARAVTKTREKDEKGEVHVLDIGSGTGLLSLMAAKAGATSVVGCDIHEPLCDVARKAMAANGQTGRVSIVNRDVGLLQRGREVRPLGVNMVVADVFDGGLIGDGFLSLFEMAKRAVVQPGATVVPAAATVHCLGVEAVTGSVQGVDLSGLDKYRWSSEYENINLRGEGGRSTDCVDGDLQYERQYKVLTRPARVTEHVFTTTTSGSGSGAQKDNSILKLEVIKPGIMNAVIFWFDLHLDDEETLSNAPPGILPGGILASDILHPLPEEEEEKEEIVDVTEKKKDKKEGTTTATTSSVEKHDQYMASSSFQGAKPGWVFKTDHLGTGYYKDDYDDDGTTTSTTTTVTQQESVTHHSPPHSPPPHYWGQAIQYLDRSLAVEPGRKVMVLSRREGTKYKFSLRQGVGEWSERAPWRIEWGGGASVENPHFQRVHYCELLVRDFLMRCKSKRFPSIEKDMKMALAHCGSLLLDPAALQDVYHEMVVLERLHSTPEFSPGASLEAVTRPALFLD